MAIWQWDVWIVPRRKVIELHSVVPGFMDLDWFESTDWWEALSEEKFSDFFSSVLPVYFAPWAKNTKSWGSNDGDRIELMVENGTITDVVIRIDLRNLNYNLIDSLSRFAKQNDLLFYSLEFHGFIEPEVQELLIAIQRLRKMQGPEKYLEDKNYIDKINKENLKKIRKAESD